MSGATSSNPALDCAQFDRLRMIRLTSNHHLALTGAIELDHEDALPGAECEAAVDYRDRLAGREQEMHQVRVCVGTFVGRDRRLAAAHVVVIVGASTRA